MSCVSVTLARVDDCRADITRVGVGTADLRRIGGAQTSLQRIGGMSAQLGRIGGLKCRFSPVCASGVGSPYLEISPTIVWIWTEPAYNDVYSNTRWNVE